MEKRTRLREADYYLTDDETDLKRTASQDEDLSWRAGSSSMNFLEERLPEMLLASLPANYAVDDTPANAVLSPVSFSSAAQFAADTERMMAENAANQSIEAADDNSWRARLAALLVPLGILLSPIFAMVQFVANTKAEIADWLWPKPEPVLRRSRRLRGLAPDQVEELKRQRRMRCAKRQPAANGVPVPRGPEADLSGESDEEEEEVVAKQPQLTKRHSVSLFSLLSHLKAMFFRSTNLDQVQPEPGDVPLSTSYSGLLKRPVEGEQAFFWKLWWQRCVSYVTRSGRHAETVAVEQQRAVQQKLGSTTAAAAAPGRLAGQRESQEVTVSPEAVHHWGSGFLRNTARSAWRRSSAFWSAESPLVEEKQGTRNRRLWLLLALLLLLAAMLLLACMLWPAVCPRPLHTATNTVTETIKAAANKMASAFSSGRSLLQNSVSKVGESLSNRAAGLADWINAFMAERPGLETALQLLRRPWGLVYYVGQQLYSLAASLMNNTWTGLSSAATGAWDSLGSVTGTAWSGLAGVASGAVNLAAKLWNSVASLGTGSWETFYNMMGNIWAGLGSLLSWGAQATTSGLSSLPEAAAWILRSIWYPVSLAWSGLQWVGSQLSQGLQDLTSGSWELVSGVPAALVKGLSIVWYGALDWLLYPLLTALYWLQNTLVSLWSLLMSWMLESASSVPSSAQLASGALSLPLYLSHLVSSAWDRTKAFVYRPKLTPAAAPHAEIDINALVEKILENQRFREALATLVQANQVEHYEGASSLLVAQYSNLESDLNGKLEGRLSAAREELMGLAKSLTEEQAQDMQASGSSNLRTCIFELRNHFQNLFLFLRILKNLRIHMDF
jgi:hypothetical protein